MAINGNINQNNTTFGQAILFKKKLADGVPIVTKPIGEVERIVNNTVDTFVPESVSEETKNNHKTAIRVGSTVIVLSLIVALLNPKFSSKFIDKFKKAGEKYKIKAMESNSFVRKLYNFAEKTFFGAAKVLKFSNNYNTCKDQLTKWLCKKSVIFKKPHDVITGWFDKISKRTVYKKFSKAESGIENLNKIINEYKASLPEAERLRVEQLMKQAEVSKPYVSRSAIETRLNDIEKTMENLEKDSKDKISEFFKGSWNFATGKGDSKPIKDNFNFWAENILLPKKQEVEAKGLENIQKLVGDGKNKKGIYEEISEILAKHVGEEKKNTFDASLKNVTKRLRDATKSECTDYFDKKRDLVLGSAPTDVLSALIALSGAGIVIGNAKTKDERISKTVKVAGPAIGGLGVSMAMTALLYSGVKGMLIGAAASILMSLAGSKAEKFFLKNKPETATNKKNGVQNA